VIVIGAGISGLAAAWRLRKGGIEALVLERSERPGGRIHTVHVNDCVMEAGANFVTDAYTVIPRLADELGLRLRPVAHRSAIAIGGALHPFHASRPWSAVVAGVMPMLAAVGSAPGLSRYAALAHGRGTVDPLDWLDLDETRSRDWAVRLGLGTLAERSWRPAINGFYFQESLDSSAGFVAAMAAHGLRQHALTVEGGMSGLIGALADRVDVRTGVYVQTVRERSGIVEVATTGGGYEAEAVIVAVPAAALPGLLRHKDGVEALAATPYSTGLLVGMAINRPLGPDELAGAYGVLMHPDEGPLAAMCVASRAGHAVPGLDLVTCMFTDAEARRLSALSDTEIIAAARRSLLAWAPSLGSALRDEEHRLFRIPAAMPMSAPGRLAIIEAYRQLAPGRCVVLAGDSLAWPWSDSAAFAGEWAADRVLELVVPD
jgi:protoporphyrinogen oxidase